MRARGVYRFPRSRDHSRARARMRGVARSPENNITIPTRVETDKKGKQKSSMYFKDVPQGAGGWVALDDRSLVISTNSVYSPEGALNPFLVNITVGSIIQYASIQIGKNKKKSGWKDILKSRKIIPPPRHYLVSPKPAT